MRHIYQGFWCEKRGRRWVGFCDDGCKLETGPGLWRDYQWAVVAAMNTHRSSVHDGITQLEIDYDKINPVNPDGTYKF